VVLDIFAQPSCTTVKTVARHESVRHSLELAEKKKKKHLKFWSQPIHSFFFFFWAISWLRSRDRLDSKVTWLQVG
jgi:hypothetical protein